MPEPAALVRDGGVIADGYSAELDELRALQTNAGEFLVALEARERERTGIPNLKVEYNRVHGFYIEVTNAHAGKGARRLPPPPDAEERRALHHAGAEDLRGQGAVGARPRARAGENAVRGAARTALQPHIAGAAAHRARLAQTRCARLRLRARRPRRNYCRPEFVDETLHRDRGRPPPGGRGADRAVHRQRRAPRRRRGSCCSSPAPTWAASPPTCARWR